MFDSSSRHREGHGLSRAVRFRKKSDFSTRGISEEERSDQILNPRKSALIRARGSGSSRVVQKDSEKPRASAPQASRRNSDPILISRNRRKSVAEEVRITCIPMPARHASGLCARPQRHCHERSDQRRGKKLSDYGLSYGQRSSERIERRNRTADGGESSETEISKLGCELVDVPRRRSKVKGPRVYCSRN
jgi:hypothetical protein